MIILAPIFVYYLKAQGAAIFVDLVAILGVILIYKRLLGFVDIDFRRNFVAPFFSVLCAVFFTFVIMRYCGDFNLALRLIIKILSFLSVYLFLLILLTKNELENKLQYIFSLFK